MKNQEIIVSDPNVMLGKPVIKGTRITVELILEKLGNGQSIESILSDYEHISKEQVLAAINYAANIFKADIIYPIAS